MKLYLVIGKNCQVEYMGYMERQIMYINIQVHY